MGQKFLIKKKRDFPATLDLGGGGAERVPPGAHDEIGIQDMPDETLDAEGTSVLPKDGE